MVKGKMWQVPPPNNSWWLDWKGLQNIMYTLVLIMEVVYLERKLKPFSKCLLLLILRE
jgi:hypothetical protein